MIVHNPSHCDRPFTLKVRLNPSRVQRDPRRTSNKLLSCSSLIKRFILRILPVNRMNFELRISAKKDFIFKKIRGVNGATSDNKHRFNFTWQTVCRWQDVERSGGSSTEYILTISLFAGRDHQFWRVQVCLCGDKHDWYIKQNFRNSCVQING